MRKAIFIIRTMLGLLFLFTSISYFFRLSPEPAYVGEFKAFQVGTFASDYLIPIAKAVELLCGISFVSGKFTTLANIVIFPVIINILFITYYLTPDNMPVALFAFLGNIFLIYSHWHNYKGLFKIDDAI